MPPGRVRPGQRRPLGTLRYTVGVQEVCVKSTTIAEDELGRFLQVTRDVMPDHHIRAATDHVQVCMCMIEMPKNERVAHAFGGCVRFICVFFVLVQTF